MKKNLKLALSTGLMALVMALPYAHAADYMANPCNPCKPKAMNPCNPCKPKAMNPCNPCKPKMLNPCAPKNACNPCAPKNPCGASGKIDPKMVTRPAGTHLMKGDPKKLEKMGEGLWNDKKLSTNGLACSTCHANYGAFAATFVKPYPHTVKMAKDRSGLKKVHLDEMVQLCMLEPMAAKPLPWGSKKLAALTAYTAKVQKGFMVKAGKNPCAPWMSKAKNPCNPCAPKVKNPCNPCNPCAPKAKNPCNPCAGK